MNIKTKTQIVTIDGQDVPMRISGATPILYRNEFHKDMLVSMAQLQSSEQDGESVTIPEGAIETLLEIAFIMAKQGDSSMKKTYVEWLDEISFESITDGTVLTAVMNMFNKDKETLVEDKKKADQQTEK